MLGIDHNPSMKSSLPPNTPRFAFFLLGILGFSFLSGCGSTQTDPVGEIQKDREARSGAVYGRVQHEAGALGKRKNIGTVEIIYRNEWTGEVGSAETEEGGGLLWNLPRGRYEISELRMGYNNINFAQGHGIRFRVISGKTVYIGSLTFQPPTPYRHGGLDILDDYENETPRLAQRFPVLKKKPPLKGLMFRLPAGDHGRMFVDAVVNEKVLVPFLLDTGASHTIITRSTAESLGLDDWESLDWMIFSTSGGQVRSPILELDSIRVGDTELEDVEVAVDVDSHLTFGLLGMNFLKHFRVVVDHKRQQIQLLP